MILDSLENSKRIECIHPLFKQAFDYVKSTDFSKMEDGKYDIADAFISTNLPPIRKSIPDNSPFISRKTGTPRVSAKGISGRWLSRSRSNNIEYPICSARITS